MFTYFSPLKPHFWPLIEHKYLSWAEKVLFFLFPTLHPGAPCMFLCTGPRASYMPNWWHRQKKEGFMVFLGSINKQLGDTRPAAVLPVWALLCIPERSAHFVVTWSLKAQHLSSQTSESGVAWNPALGLPLRCAFQARVLSDTVSSCSTSGTSTNLTSLAGAQWRPL